MYHCFRLKENQDLKKEIEYLKKDIENIGIVSRDLDEKIKNKLKDMESNIDEKGKEFLKNAKYQKSNYKNVKMFTI